MLKIGIIIFYCGKFPAFLSQFLAGCAFNGQIKWLLFSDQPKPDGCPENMSYNYLNIKTFNKLASEKFGFTVKIDNPYKLCDFRPAYGKIFEDYLNEFTYWGYSDIDIIFGDICKFIPAEFIRNYEIISFYSGFCSGPFCLYRNNKKTKTLFRNCPDHQKIFQNPDHFAFDENIGITDIKGLSIKKMFHFIFYTSKNLLLQKKYSFKLAEFKYQFQWYYKRKNIIKNNPVDITEAVFEAVRKKELNASFSQLISSDHFLRRIGRKKWIIKWESGILTDIHTGKEIFAFHFPLLKSFEDVKIDPYIIENKCFLIYESGIKNG